MVSRLKSSFIFLSNVVDMIHLCVEKFPLFLYEVLSVNFVKIKSISNFSHNWCAFPRSLKVPIHVQVWLVSLAGLGFR